jgi:hypothetical protein
LICFCLEFSSVNFIHFRSNHEQLPVPQNKKVQQKCNLSRFLYCFTLQSAGCTSQDGVIDDELLVKTRTNTCLSYTSAVPSYSVIRGPEFW